MAILEFQVWQYQVKCDRCGRILDEYGHNDEYASMSDPGEARYEAEEQDWLITEDRDICPLHVEYDEETGLPKEATND